MNGGAQLLISCAFEIKLSYLQMMAELLTRVPRVRKVKSSNPKLAKSCIALQTVRNSLNLLGSSCVALALCRGYGHCKLIICFGEYNERFDFGSQRPVQGRSQQNRNI